jgi:hypothetical protein
LTVNVLHWAPRLRPRERRRGAGDVAEGQRVGVGLAREHQRGAEAELREIQQQGRFAPAVEQVPAGEDARVRLAEVQVPGAVGVEDEEFGL